MEFHIDDLPTSAGADLGHSSWHRVNQADINAFAELTHDRQWIHVDPVRSTEGPFGTTIVHGYFTLSLVSVMLLELLTVRGVANSLNYGLDRLRFPMPLPVDSNIRAHGRLTKAEPVAGGVRTTTRITIAAEGTSRPTCVADVLTQFHRHG